MSSNTRSGVLVWCAGVAVACICLNTSRSFAQPPNDLCTSAITINGPFTGSGVTVNGINTTGATQEVGVVACGTVFPSQRKGVWYRVVGTGRTLTASTCPSPLITGAAPNTMIAVFCGTCSALTCVANNDDAASCTVPPTTGLERRSSVSWCSVTSQAYLIWVGPFSTSTALTNISLNITDDGVTCTGGVVCTTCSPPCPPGAVQESGEVCGLPTTVNQGCDGASNGFQDVTLSCGTTLSICGQAQAASGIRDSDWYRFQVVGAQISLSASATAQFPPELTVYKLSGAAPGICPATQVTNGQATAAACGTAALSGLLLLPGSYAVAIQPTATTGFSCGGTSTNYVISLSCVGYGACCVDETGNCQITTQAECTTQGGISWQAGGACTLPNLCLGRCCHNDGSCTDTVAPPNSCAAVGDRFGGAGSTCGLVSVLTFGGVNLVIPDGNPAGSGYGPTASDVQTLSGLPSLMMDVDVNLKINHTWVGDLYVEVTHLGTTVTIIDGIGQGPATGGGGCAGDNLDIILDDEGTGGSIDTPVCGALPAVQSPPSYMPLNPLSAFDGMDPNGEWTVSLKDGFGGFAGTLIDWSLHVTSVMECTGACCTGAAHQTCTLVNNPPACTAAPPAGLGGVYQGDGTNCHPTPCAENRACCVGGSCSMEGSVECAALGGVWQAAGSACSPDNPCTGACCKPDGTCANLTQTDCQAIQFAVFQGNPTNCAGASANCPQTGACCKTDNTCSILTQAACEGDPAFYRWTGGITCTPNNCVGQCCDFNSGTCTLTTAPNCAAPNIYGGDGTICATAEVCQGRCCNNNDGICFLSGPGGCTDADHTFGGVGTNCTPNLCAGRCCHNTGLCENLPLNSCNQPGDNYGGDGTTCSATGEECQGACCVFDSGACILSGPAGCQSPDIFASVGSTCATVTCSGRCCKPDGSCSVTSAGGCQLLNGTFSLGQDCNSVQVLTFSGVNLVIPLGLPDPGGFGPTASNIQTVTGVPGPITDVDVDVNIVHTWAGDPKVVVEHQNVQVTVIDLMGHPLPDAGGCATPNIDVILDDEGSGGPIETQCSTVGPPAALSPPNYTPGDALGPYTPGGLSAFDGLDPNGEWTILVSDGYLGDSGTLVSWSLHLGFAGQVCTPTCPCFGDFTGDTLVNGKDIKGFSACVIAGGGAGCTCADMNHVGGVTTADIAPFVAKLLAGTACGTPPP